MNEELIESVAACLSPVRFNVRGINFSMEESFQPDLDSDQEYSIYIRYKVARHAVISSESGDETLLRWYGSSGIRLARVDTEDPDEFLVNIDVDFVETYRLRRDCEVPESSGLKEFGVHNVQYHVWPFLREIFQSMGDRMGVGAIPLPHYIMKMQKESNSQGQSE